MNRRQLMSRFGLAAVALPVIDDDDEPMTTEPVLSQADQLRAYADQIDRGDVEVVRFTVITNEKDDFRASDVHLGFIQQKPARA